MKNSKVLLCVLLAVLLMVTAHGMRNLYHQAIAPHPENCLCDVCRVNFDIEREAAR